MKNKVKYLLWVALGRPGVLMGILILRHGIVCELRVRDMGKVKVH